MPTGSDQGRVSATGAGNDDAATMVGSTPIGAGPHVVAARRHEAATSATAAASDGSGRATWMSSPVEVITARPGGTPASRAGLTPNDRASVGSASRKIQ